MIIRLARGGIAFLYQGALFDGTNELRQLFRVMAGQLHMHNCLKIQPHSTGIHHRAIALNHACVL